MDGSSIRLSVCDLVRWSNGVFEYLVLQSLLLTANFRKSNRRKIFFFFFNIWLLRFYYCVKIYQSFFALKKAEISPESYFNALLYHPMYLLGSAQCYYYCKSIYEINLGDATIYHLCSRQWFERRGSFSVQKCDNFKPKFTNFKFKLQQIF